jgi:hypothetical protein
VTTSKDTRELSDVIRLYDEQVKNLQQYFWKKCDSFLHQAVIKADDCYTPLYLMHATGAGLPSDDDSNKGTTRKWAQKHYMAFTHMILTSRMPIRKYRAVGRLMEISWMKLKDM